MICKNDSPYRVSQVHAEIMTQAMNPRRNRLKRAVRFVLAGAVVMLALFYGLWICPFWGFPFNHQRHGRVPLTPAWALECWLWEDDHSTADAIRQLLDGYKQHDIPVRTVILDSPWSTRYNDFAFDEQRYPKPQQFIRSLKDSGYRVVLWMTCMVNSRNSDTTVRDAHAFYETARAQGYLAGNGHQVRWWKGVGAFIDYTNPEAMNWWHGLQQPLFDWRIDGWKLDGTDTLFSSRGFLPYQKTSRGWISTRSYMDLYAREEYLHGLSRNPEFIIMTRGMDNRYFPLSHPEGCAPLDAAPVVWVGDRIHAWSSKTQGGEGDQDAVRKKDSSWMDRGFEGALRDILASSAKGYCMVGDDVGGYHGPEPIPPRLYIRWAQFAAFTGFFLNGGHGERALWKRTPEELEIIRQYAWMHTELVPYLYTQVVLCHQGGLPLMRPVLGKYHYRLGEDLLVAPIYRDNLTNKVELPQGRWRHFFHDAEVLEGPQSLTREFALSDFPVYVREGAVLPLNVSRAYTGFGDASSEGLITWCIYPHGNSEFTLHHPDRSGTTRVQVHETDELALSLTGVKKPHILRIYRETPPTGIQLDGKTLAQGKDWRYDSVDRRLWIRTLTYDEGQYVIR
jgi:alpha-glucosidase (family GH31 glycosyl hydrolase)